MKKALEEEILRSIEEIMPQLSHIAKTLYENPEIGGEEKLASRLLCEFLTENGFSVEKDYWKIPHAFRAVYDSGREGAAVGLFAEYDALPDIGHGCGHNLICVTSLGAAVSLKKAVDESGGKVVVFGTPGEENLQTKTVMTPEGAFDEIDVAMMIHPQPEGTSCCEKTLAVESLQIDFFGKASHAGLAPEEGINALNAAVLCYTMISMKKQYFPETNVHGIIGEGGKKASVITPYANLKYLTRAWDMERLADLRTMVENCAEAAAKATGCSFKVFNNEMTNAALMSNKHILDVFEKYLRRFGEENISHEDVKISTDMGDVSQRIPSIHPLVSLDCPDAALHSKEFAEATMTDYAEVYLRRCISALCFTAAEILEDEKLLEDIKSEFASKKRGA